MITLRHHIFAIFRIVKIYIIEYFVRMLGRTAPTFIKFTHPTSLLINPATIIIQTLQIMSAQIC